jgi:hypothetical protein
MYLNHFYHDPVEVVLFFIAIPVVVLLAFGVLPFWCICKKAGFPAWYSLVILVPPFNIAFLFFMAFAEWPVRRQLEIASGRRLPESGMEPARAAGPAGTLGNSVPPRL